MAYRAIANFLKERREFPKRLDEMSPEEYAIAKIAMDAFGIMLFAQRTMEPHFRRLPLAQKPAPPTPLRRARRGR